MILWTDWKYSKVWVKLMSYIPNSVPKLNKIAYNIYFVLIIVFDPEFAC